MLSKQGLNILCTEDFLGGIEYEFIWFGNKLEEDISLSLFFLSER